MPKNKAKSKPNNPDTPCRCGGRRPSSCSLLEELSRDEYLKLGHLEKLRVIQGHMKDAVNSLHMALLYNKIEIPRPMEEAEIVVFVIDLARDLARKSSLKRTDKAQAPPTRNQSTRTYHATFIEAKNLQSPDR